MRSAQDRPPEIVEEAGYLQDARDLFIYILLWPANFGRSVLLPWYRKQRADAKEQVSKLLYGDSPFACRVRFTGINFLVFCSIVFLFLENINLAFLSAKHDKQFAMVGA